MPMRLCGSLLLTVLAASTATAEPAPDVMAAVASPNRPAADRMRDAERKPTELVTFSTLKTGDTIADFVPGPVYFTRIFSAVVGGEGRVFAYTPGDLLTRSPKAADDARALAAQAGYENVTEIETPLAEMAFSEPLDVFWISQIYHDLAGIWGADAPAKFNAAVFDALKPGGVYIVTDHVASPGLDEAEMEALHRIDPALVVAQATAAGFVVDAESDVLANPDDSREMSVFEPAIRGHTDQFLIRFRKPVN